MAGRAQKSGSLLVGLLVIAAVAVWGFQQYEEWAAQAAAPAGEHVAVTGAEAAAQESPAIQGAYEVYPHCTLVEARNNDGDSFLVRLPDGRQKELRLYFVDAPESAFKRYRNGETNAARIRQQAAALGGITEPQAVEIGKKAKHYTRARLEREPFTIYTSWDSPFQDDRYHAFVEVREGGKRRWLHELLVEQGYVRIHTKPADLPDGTPAEVGRQQLRARERAAKQAERGAWGL